MLMNKPKFIQYNLWLSCNNNCSFCCNLKESKEETDADRIRSLKYVLDLLDLDEVKEYQRIGIIGGEFFQKQLNNPEIKDLFYQVLEKISGFVQDWMIQFNFTATLITDNRADLIEFLEFLKSKEILHKSMLCTSYDTIYRFHNDIARKLWIQNMKWLHVAYPELSLHTEFVITQHLIDTVLNNKLNFKDFSQEYCCSVDFLEPVASLISFSSKDSFVQTVSDFLPHRQDFLKFLRKVYSENQVNLRFLLNNELLSDTLYKLCGNQYIKETHRNLETSIKIFDNSSNSPLPMKLGYIDSDRSMRSDVLKFLACIE